MSKKNELEYTKIRVKYSKKKKITIRRAKNVWGGGDIE